MLEPINYLRTHRFWIKFGDFELRTVKNFTLHPSKSKEFSVQFYLTSDIIDFIAKLSGEPFNAEVTLTSKDDQIESRMVFENVTVNGLAKPFLLDCALSEVAEVEVSFLYNDGKWYGSMADNGPLDKHFVL